MKNKNFVKATVAITTLATFTLLAGSFVSKPQVKATLDRIEDNNIAVVEVCYNDNIQMVDVPLGEHLLDMRDVVDYEATSDGLHLITADGNGYFLEIYK